MGKKTNTDGFFAYQKEKSKIKTMIVTDFFKAYFPIINSGFKTEKIYYLDFFCGPGQYEDGMSSTPLVLLDLIDNFKSNDIRDKLSVVFNDQDSNIVSKLHTVVDAHPVLQRMKYKPQILNCEASKINLTQYTNQRVPIFSFIDPWGYIDVSAEQIWTLVRNYGSDCVLFFNADRILQDISKPTQKGYFQQIFGDLLPQARNVQTSSLTQRLKLESFLKLFSQNLYNTMSKEKEMKYKLFVLPFCVEADDKEKTSHYIVFITKAYKAIIEMKNVMLKHNNYTSDILGFDSKDQLQISLISRKDNLTNSILASIKSLLIKYPKNYSVDLTVEKLSEKLDTLSMLESYQVLPYTIKEVKETVEFLNEKGCIKILLVPGKKIIKPITFGREFRILNRIMEL